MPSVPGGLAPPGSAPRYQAALPGSDRVTGTLCGARQRGDATRRGSARVQALAAQRPRNRSATAVTWLSGTTHSVTTLGTGVNKLITFVSSDSPGAAPAPDPDPFAHIKAGSTGERDAMIANFRKVPADFDADEDGKLSPDEAPVLIRDRRGRTDLTLDDLDLAAEFLLAACARG